MDDEVTLKSQPLNLSEAENQRQVTTQITKIFALLLIYLSSVKDAVSGGEQTRKAKAKGGRKVDALYAPKWIGEKYRIKREPGDGTHASPRGHPRKGFTMNQAFGPGYSQHRPIWIAPVWVGGGND